MRILVMHFSNKRVTQHILVPTTFPKKASMCLAEPGTWIQLDNFFVCCYKNSTRCSFPTVIHLNNTPIHVYFIASFVNTPFHFFFQV